VATEQNQSTDNSDSRALRQDISSVLQGTRTIEQRSKDYES